MFLERYFPASKVGSIKKEICGIRSMIDVASGGALVDKTSAASRSLISNMVSNSQQFGICQDPNLPPKLVNEVSTSNVNLLGQQLAQLTAVVQQLTLGQQMYCEPFSQTYNPGWCDHPNLRYGNQQQAAPQSTPARPPGFTFQQRSQQNFVPRTMQAPQATQPLSTKPSIEDLINAIATNMLQFQQTTQASIKSLENQVGQLAASYNRLEAHLSNKLPSQLERNPKENVSVLTLQSSIQYEPPTQPSSPAPVQKQAVDNSIHDEPSMQKKSHKPTMPTYVSRPPFPSRLKIFKQEEADKEILETFRKVEVNIPLLDAIKQVPRYAKFLKELCTNKKKLKGEEKISVRENASAVLQKKLPPKCKDPGTFTIPCMIGNKMIEQCMIDLGASINVMS
ncbi:uncharacterized protein LOC133825246 [Humulus lupulus]|uniref:uncharacterized protein LOC133825246 n=1 Tax=Humulus lupulus TaxID=3486 RepID=UPI002B407338|nr:uncharacterized protein LOC133825246 [Humulus lupulus]